MPTPVKYTDWIMRGVPSWCQGKTGTAILTAHAKNLDELLDGFKQAIQCRFMLMGPEDALPFIGAERLLPQYPNESNDNYRIRLWNAWVDWRWAGTDTGIITQVKYAMNLENVTIRTNAMWDPTPPDGNTTWWSRFWLVIEEPFPWELRKWGEGIGTDGITQPNEWGDPPTRLWGSTITKPEVDLLRSILQKWKASHAWCEAVILKFDDYEYKIRMRF